MTDAEYLFVLIIKNHSFLYLTLQHKKKPSEISEGFNLIF
ncbi:hypothetical protein M2372_001942 [Chryseobacterium sp. BIGb0232]|nr:hypothetical protein [Chryseobacterium sp. BIGb0232]ROS18443.1 hypothetical protein EDF65_2839 [Chryseobacterium nakagawai]